MPLLHERKTMEDRTPEQFYNAYMGDIMDSLIKEAALWKARASQLEQMVAQLRHEAAVKAKNEQPQTASQDEMQFLRERGI